MKLKKFYTLYDCIESEKVYSILNQLQEEEKIEYQLVEENEWEVVKITDLNLSEEEVKNLLKDFAKFEVAEYEYVLDEPYDDSFWSDDTERESWQEDWYSDPEQNDYSRED